MAIDNATTAADVQTVMLAGQRFVIVPEGEYRRLRQAADGDRAGIAPADARGYYPAVETMRALLARDILRQRRRWDCRKRIWRGGPASGRKRSTAWS